MSVNIKIIKAEKIKKTVKKLCIKTNLYMSDDIHKALCCAKKIEVEPLPNFALDTILKNADVAKSEKLPICQDTGMVVVFVDIGHNVHINGDITAAINQGVKEGYSESYFRNSIVADPINRINTGDNTPAIIHYDFIPGDEIKITMMPKGFGSENKSGLCMLTPSDGISGVKNFVLEIVKKAGADPCPPIIVGVGVGGTMEKAALLSKKALLRKIKSTNIDSFWNNVENELLQKINLLEIGVSGFGGKTTALDVFIETHPTHIAGLPVAVNIACHVSRHKSVIINS